MKTAEEILEELQKCKDSPVYFYNKYVRREGQKELTKVEFEDFVKQVEYQRNRPSKIPSFPENIEIWKWWQTQKFQKEQGEQEYTMIYEIDLPKILKAFTEQFPNCV